MDTDRLIYAKPYTLEELPPGFRFRSGPIEMRSEVWSDGIIQITWEETALYGAGRTIEAARQDLLENLASFAIRLSTENRVNLGGPLLEHWEAFKSAVEITGT
jgi:hypothetical protein